MSLKAEARIEGILRRIALWIGISVACAVPAGYGVMAYLDQSGLQGLAAHFSARQIGLYAYVQGNTWRYSNHRVGEILELFTVEQGPTRQYVYDDRGDTVVVIGDPQAWPRLRVSAPIIAGPHTVGEVVAESSLIPLLLRCALLAVLGGLLGFSAYLVVHMATTALRRAADDLQQQHAKTEAALRVAETERRNAELASRSKSEFLANMSHELRTPLNAVIGFSDVMQQKMMGPLSEVYASYAADIHASGQHLLGVIGDILDLAKIEAGQASLSAEYCDLTEIIDASLRLTNLRAQKHGVTISTNLDFPAGRMGTVDPVKTKQILLNLLSNAVKFTPRNGSVTLDATYPEPGVLCIRVRDTGIGMSAQEIDLAFQPFRQISSTLSKRFEGTGLGLPISRKFAELQGGSLTISSAPGMGTTVTVLLPVGEHRAENAA